MKKTIYTMLILAVLFCAILTGCNKDKENSKVAIIGGGDGPTTIFVAS